MNLESEIRRLIEIMPASGRMYTKIISRPQQSQVIEMPFPKPWKRDNRPIYINFDLWNRLSRPQRDLLLLRAVSYLTNIKWFKLDIYQGATLVGVAGVIVEMSQGDALGTIVAGGLSVVAASQIWRRNRSIQTQIEADQEAIKIALRRGYTEVEAARNLLESIESVAKLERRKGLNFTELIRSQNLKAIANISPVGVPESLRQK